VKHLQKTVKMRFLVALVGLVIFACRETKTPPGPLEFSLQIVALGKKIDDAFNSNDAAALAPFYAEDAALVAREGLFDGRNAIAKYWVNVFQKIRFSNHLLSLEPFTVHVIDSGNKVIATLRFSQTAEGLSLDSGYWSCVFVREGDTLRILSQAITAASTGTPSQTTTPSNQ
jgi:ketosteroid isomerase-like protein